MNTFAMFSPQERDLGGGFVVRRLLPQATRASVGPFVFFDHFGPITAGPQDQHDVRPHPHIGLATVTYLFEGAMQHRDSTGAVQRIEPGAINWMTAGRGIVHSERTPDDLRQTTRHSHGLQLWVALPTAFEECLPRFEHTPAERLPGLSTGGAEVRVLVGHAHGLRSPVNTLSPTLYVDYRLAAGAELLLPAAEAGVERALYGVDAPFELVSDGETQPIPPRTLVVLPRLPSVLSALSAPDAPAVPATGPLRLRAKAPARVVMIGGQAVGKRHLWWNFVSSDPARIRRAAAEWEAGRFDTVPGETERIPLPERRLK